MSTNRNEALRAALEPCPLCQTEASIVFSGEVGRFDQYDVDCTGCGLYFHGPAIAEGEAAKAATIAAWNRRPSPVAGGDLRDWPDQIFRSIAKSKDVATCRHRVATLFAALNQPAAPVEAAADDHMRIENAECEGMDKGADFCIKTLAEALGVDDWDQADGSETWHGDVAGTIYNVLKAGRVYDDEDGRVARLDAAHPPEPAASTVAQGDVVALCNKCGYHGPVDHHGQHKRPNDGQPCYYMASRSFLSRTTQPKGSSDGQ